MLEDLKPEGRKFTCRVRTVLSELEIEDRAIFIKAIEDEKTWPSKTLEKALSQRGVIVADTSIMRHRKGYCSCSKN